MTGKLLLQFWVVAVLVACARCQYQTGQATYYNSIDHGYCGFGANIPSNGFVAAWPFIETGPNGQGYAQPGANGQGCGSCIEVSCIPQYVESADGSIYLDRRDACADPNRAVVVRIVDECRCSLPRDSNLPKGNFNWCCNTPTPRLRINRHVDLSQQAFTALVKDGAYGLGIIGIRWRPTSCARIGVVSIGGSAPVPQIPATSSAATVTPQAPNPPPQNNNWNNVGALQKEDARENTQELPLISQCGGNGGDCKKYGPGNLCRDQPFTGYTCAKSLTCERQNNYYWQCVSPDRNNIQTNSNKPSATSSTSSNTNKPSSAADKVLKEGVQCGGKGAKCQDYGACVDGLFPGYTCDKGLTCNRQNEWYHQCEKTAGVTAQGGNANKAPSGTATRPPATNTKKPASTTTNTHKKPSSQPTNGSKTQGRTLREVEQCGGKGAKCEEYGSCADKAFPGYACSAGLTCNRQNEWYWQCDKSSTSKTG